MDQETKLRLVLAVLNIPLYLLIGWLFFGTWSKARQKLVELPDAFSPRIFWGLLFGGEFSEAFKLQLLALRFAGFIVACVFAVTLEFTLISGWLDK